MRARIVTALTLPFLLSFAIAPPRAAMSVTRCGASVTSLPKLPVLGTNEVLWDVAGSSPRSAWAVGYWTDDGGRHKTAFAFHWDGASWTQAPLPSTGYTVTELASVWVFGPSLAIAVGETHTNYPSSGDRFMAFRYNGTSWRPVKAISGARGGWTGVDGTSASDIWTVGSLYGSGPVTAHFDGTGWTMSSAPGPRGGALAGVGDVGSGDVWGVSVSGTGQPVADHYDGTSWSRSTTPTFDVSAGLDGVDGLAGTDVWAVGSSGAVPFRPLILRWSSGEWSIDDTIALPDSYLRGVAVRNEADVWAVGRDVQGSRGVVARWNGSAWSSVSTSNLPAYSFVSVHLVGSQVWLGGERTTQQPLVARICP
jgi:hypothetical protein